MQLAMWKRKSMRTFSLLSEISKDIGGFFNVPVTQKTGFIKSKGAPQETSVGNQLRNEQYMQLTVQSTDGTYILQMRTARHQT